MSVTYTAVLPVRDETVDFLAGLLVAERARRGTRADTRALSCHDQAVLVLRWFLDGTRMKQLARDNGIGKSTGYDYLHEGIDVLAARAPGLHGALLAAKAAGYSHVNIDGMLVETDRVSTPGPTPGVDLWWSGKHDNHGGNVQVISVPDGWPIWTSEVRPGREHDTTAVRTHGEILPALVEAGGDLRTLGDLGYEGESDTTVAFKKPKGGRLTPEQQQLNKAHNSLRDRHVRFGRRALEKGFKHLANVLPHSRVGGPALDVSASRASSTGLPPEVVDLVVRVAGGTLAGDADGSWVPQARHPGVGDVGAPDSAPPPAWPGAAAERAELDGVSAGAGGVLAGGFLTVATVGLTRLSVLSSSSLSPGASGRGDRASHRGVGEPGGP